MAKKIKHLCLTGWRVKVDKAEKRGHFTDNEVHAAGNWNTCAVGEAHKLNKSVAAFRKDFYGYDVPKDKQLSRFGCSFSLWVDRNNPEKARMVLDKIETRLNELTA